MLRLTKIVATLGPASSSRPVVEGLVAAGLDVARLNFSHGTWSDHAQLAARVRAAARAAGRPIALLQDLQGPRIRLGRLRDGRCALSAGQAVEFVPGARDAVAPSKPWRAGVVVLSTTYAPLAREVKKGERILLRDGAVELRVESVRSGRVRAEVVRGGEVRTHSGINAPDSHLRAPAFTAKDRADLAFGARIGVDAIALSFVRSGAEVRRVKQLLRKRRSKTLVIAKIERREAIDDLDAILREADGVMVARGDLGVELSPEAVPLLQKEIIRRAIRSHTFVITATQMLESMVTQPAPTRAEVSDVANAVLDGTDAVMLSAETAAGRFPVAAVAAMDRILRHVERDSVFTLAPEPKSQAPADDFLFALSGAAVRLAEQSGARVLMPFTVTGRTAAIVATYRPDVPILAYSLHPETRRRLVFWRGVHPRALPHCQDLAETFACGVLDAAKAGLVNQGDVVVLVGGHALARGASNTLQIVRVGPEAAITKKR